MSHSNQSARRTQARDTRNWGVGLLPQEWQALPRPILSTMAAFAIQGLWAGLLYGHSPEANSDFRAGFFLNAATLVLSLIALAGFLALLHR